MRLDMVTDQSLLRLLQLTDSTFPTGAFAHSFGLETYIARGTCAQRRRVGRFYYQYVTARVAPSDGVACRAAAQAGTDWEDLVQRLDHRLTAMKIVTELRQASHLSARASYARPPSSFLAPRATIYLREIDAKVLHGHMSLAYGLVCQICALPLYPALSAWFRHYCAALVSVGVQAHSTRTDGRADAAGDDWRAPIFEAVELALERVSRT